MLSLKELHTEAAKTKLKPSTCMMMIYIYILNVHVLLSLLKEDHHQKERERRDVLNKYTFLVFWFLF